MPVLLRSERAIVELRPDAGGRIGQLTVDGTPLLRGEDETTDWLHWGSYPLAPWSNRIAGARFTFRGVEHRLPVTFVDGTAIHGLVADVPWQVVHADERTAVLEVDVDVAPFALACRQAFELGEDALVQSLSITNVGADAVPAGLGIHPWFRSGPASIPATAAWPLRDCIPTGSPVPIDPDDDLRRLRVHEGVDGCFTGLVGTAAVVPGVELTWSGPIEHVVVYDAPGGWLCVEPVTNANDGFNLLAAGVDGHGVVVLEPGASLAATFAFRWRD